MAVVRDLSPLSEWKTKAEASNNAVMAERAKTRLHFMISPPSPCRRSCIPNAIHTIYLREYLASLFVQVLTDDALNLLVGLTPREAISTFKKTASVLQQTLYLFSIFINL